MSGFIFSSLFDKLSENETVDPTRRSKCYSFFDAGPVFYVSCKQSDFGARSVEIHFLTYIPMAIACLDNCTHWNNVKVVFRVI